MKFSLTGKKGEKRSEEELLEEFRSGKDPAVLGELYSGYMHLVYGVCLKYLKDRDESKDAVMQVFEKLITEIPKHRIENFRSWLHVVTKNHCLMQLRAKKSYDEKIGEWAAENIIFMENEQELHPIDGDSSEIDKALEDCIERLREEQKSCIRLFYYENRCYSEIAVNLALDEKKVKSHLQNGKRNLKICLEEKNEGKRER
jgi:RNA polymerase sigma-70 factor (ECF subfamily)